MYYLKNVMRLACCHVQLISLCFWQSMLMLSIQLLFTKTICLICHQCFDTFDCVTEGHLANITPAVSSGFLGDLCETSGYRPIKVDLGLLANQGIPGEWMCVCVCVNDKTSLALLCCRICLLSLDTWRLHNKISSYWVGCSQGKVSVTR